MSIFTVLSFVTKIWPIVSKVVPTVIAAINVANNKLSTGDEKKASVISVVRSLFPVEVISDSQLNWLIETILGILKWKATK